MLVYRKLEVWQIAKEVALEIYKITSKFPSKEKFGLTSQLNRAAVSIASNIAEGCSRSSLKEQAHFSEIAFGSLMEVACQLEIAEELGYIKSEEGKAMYEKIEKLAYKLTYYRNSQLKRISK